MSRTTSRPSGMSYGLKWNPNPPVTVAGLVTYAIAAGVYTVLSAFGVIGVPMGVVGVSALFVGIGFGIPFAMWFGGWGLLIGFIGTFVGAGLLAGMPILLAIPFGFTDWIQFGIPLLAYRLLAPRLGLHPLGRDIPTAAVAVLFYSPWTLLHYLWALLRGRPVPRGAFHLKALWFFLLFGTILPNGLGALYGVSVLMAGGLVPPASYWLVIVGWWVGNMVVSIIVAPILLSVLTPVIERFGLATHGVIT